MKGNLCDCVGGLSYFGSRKTSKKTTEIIKVSDEGDSNQEGIRGEGRGDTQKVIKVLL